MTAESSHALGRDELEDILASAMDAIIVIDEQQNVVLFNESAERMMMCSAEEAIGGAIDRFIPKRFLKTHHDDVNRFAESGVTRRGMGALGQVWGLRSNGEEFPIEASIGLVKSRGPRLLSVILRDVTALREGEEKLRQSERFLSTLIRNLPGVAYQCSDAGGTHLTYASEGALRLSGYTSDELTVPGFRFRDLVYEEDKALVTRGLRVAKENRNSLNLQYRLMTKGGELRWVSEHGAFISQGADLEDGHIEGIITDITDLRSAEQVLEGRSRALQELASGASLESVLLCLVKSAEDAFPGARCSILLLDERKRHLRNALAPSMPHFFVEALEGLEVGMESGSCGATAALGHRVIIKDVLEDSKWDQFREITDLAEVRACWSEPILSGDGDVLGTLAMYYRAPSEPHAYELDFIASTAQMAGIAIERHRVDEFRRINERRFRAVFNQRVELAALLTPDGALQDINATALNMVGVTHDQVVGKFLWDTPWWNHDPQLQERLKEGVEKAAQGVCERFIAYHPRSDGVLAEIDFSMYPITNEESQVELLLAEGLDITEKRRSEALLKQSEGRAREAEKLASIATLTAGIAHDIGAPMTAILGYAEMMQKSLTDEKNQRRAGIIVEQVNRVTELVQALLNMARPDVHTEAPVDLAKLIERSIGLYREMFRKRNIEVICKFESSAVIAGDSNRIQQALLNILLNAADAMKKSGGKLTISISNHDAGLAELRIADSGIGIPPEQVDYVFDPFFTTKRRGEGTGLGLLVAKSIVDEHAGTIAVESVLGEGTTFTLRFPLLPSAV